MPRTVHVYRRAATDIATTAAAYTERASTASARRWRQTVEAAIVALAVDADQWPETDEAADLGLNLRYRPVGRRHQVYRVLFLVEGNDVLVLRVLHTSRDRLTPDDL